MHEDFIRALEAGATAITAGRRLARALTAQYHVFQQEQGRAAWRTPEILPLDAFLAKAWREYVLTARRPQMTLLDEFQEQEVWEQVIRDSPAGESLLRVAETARQAMEAWRLVLEYRVPVDGRFQASEDSAAFAEWSRAFRQRCTQRNWLEAARLADVVADLLKAGEMARPATLFRAGFDELTPQQSDFFEALGGGSEVEAPQHRAPLERWGFRDSTEEIRAAAAWARLLVEQNPEARIGVIVPDLKKSRAKIERLFRATLDPAGTRDDHEAAFHVSLGPALDRYPAISTALLILEFAEGNLSLPGAGMLLRSPFLAGGETEWTRRAQIDAKLRKDGVWDVSPGLLRDRANHCPVLARAMARFEKERRKPASEQRPSEWSRDFSKLLEAAGWPGERTLSGREYQVVEKWRSLLSNLAALDVVGAAMSFAQAFTRLREMAAETSFQVENQEAPIQIMGLLEASGLEFDHLWVMGLDEETLPAASNPNPFLPISLQREYKLPHSSAEVELQFARKLMRRMVASAPHVAASYAVTKGERSLGPSPLITNGNWREASGVAPEWVTKIRSGARMEELQDETAPALVPESTQTGGTSLFKDMAACPFRAFAKHRLAARPLEETDLGLSYANRGNGVHRALAAIWRELGSQAQLLELSNKELEELILRSVCSAIEQLPDGVGRKLEQRRLVKLLSAWIEIEKTRAAFTVKATEEKQLVSLGGLEVQTRADRVDRLPDGREIILDYKTGVVRWTAWEGDRPDDPQLPLYCATSAQPIAGAAFAEIRTGELGFRGHTDPGASLPSMKEMRVDAPESFHRQIGLWQTVLERLAIDFRAGNAAVDPKDDACNHCGLRALCRIRELENARG